MRRFIRQARAVALTFGVAAALGVGAGLLRPPRPPAGIHRLAPGDIAAAVGDLFDADLAKTRSAIDERQRALAAQNDGDGTVGRDTGEARRRLAALTSSIARDRAALRALRAAASTPARPSPELATANRAVEEATQELAALEERLTEQHPDVVRQRQVVATRQAEALALAQDEARLDDDTGGTQETDALTARLAANERAAARLRIEITAASNLETGSAPEVSAAERQRLTREIETLRAVADALTTKRAEVVRRVEELAATGTDAGARAVRDVSARWLAWSLAGAALVALAVGLVRDRAARSS